MPHKINRPLSEEDAQRIKKNIRFLKENLEQDKIRDYFMEEDIWDLPDFEEIDSGVTPIKKNEIFINLLLKSGPRAYKVFIEALTQQHSTHIIEKLESTEIKDDTQGTSGKDIKNIIVTVICNSLQLILLCGSLKIGV